MSGIVIRAARAGRLALLAGAWAALGLLPCAALGLRPAAAWAQGQAQPAPAAQPPAAQPPAAGAAPGAPAAGTGKGPLVDESFSIQQDADLFQLQEAATLISRSLDKIADRVGTLAINSMYFGQGVPPDFRMKAEVIILQKLLDANANVKLVQCQECQKLETNIVSGVLRIRKGIPSVDARRELAKKLGVDGFIDIGLYREHNQMTIYLKVVEAQTGAIILVDEVVGRQAYKRDAVTLSFGEVNFPIVISKKTVSHNTLDLTANEQVQLTGRFSFGVDVSFYSDNNQNLAQPHLTLDGGILLG
ncbi:MAG TPA: hypothetical protein VL359_06895, partial [bacterium]|nr:hypothetical protein [bacterium]